MLILNEQRGSVYEARLRCSRRQGGSVEALDEAEGRARESNSALREELVRYQAAPPDPESSDRLFDALHALASDCMALIAAVEESGKASRQELDVFIESANGLISHCFSLAADVPGSKAAVIKHASDRMIWEAEGADPLKEPPPQPPLVSGNKVWMPIFSSGAPPSGVWIDQTGNTSYEE